MPYAIAAVVVGLGAAYVSGEQGKEAAGEGKEAAQQTQQMALQEYKSQSKEIQPWVDQGKKDFARLNEGIASGAYDPGKFTFDGSSLAKDKGYQFRLGEGQASLDRTAAARGKLLSGQQLKDTMEYNQNFASNEYDNAFSRARQGYDIDAARLTNTYNRDVSAVNRGIDATNSLNQLRQNRAAAFGVGTQGIANAAGQRAAASQQQIGGMANSVTQGLGAAYSIANQPTTPPPPATQAPVTQTPVNPNAIDVSGQHRD